MPAHAIAQIKTSYIQIRAPNSMNHSHRKTPKQPALRVIGIRHGGSRDSHGRPVSRGATNLIGRW